jgi:hypothetical protein
MMLYLVSIFWAPSWCVISSLSSRYLRGAYLVYFLDTFAALYLVSIFRYLRGTLSRVYFLDTLVMLYPAAVRYLVSIFRHLRGALSRLYFQIPSRRFISSLFSGYLRDV